MKATSYWDEFSVEGLFPEIGHIHQICHFTRFPKDYEIKSEFFKSIKFSKVPKVTSSKVTLVFFVTEHPRPTEHSHPT